MPPKNAEVVQKLQPMGQPTEGMMVAAVVPLDCGSFTPSVRAPNPETISGWAIGAVSSSPRKRRIQEMPSPRTMWSASIIVSMPGTAATCPPTTMVALGASCRAIRHISRTLPTLTMIDEMPTMSYSLLVSSASNAARVGKSSTVVGAEMLRWIMRRPHERWNMRSENAP